MIKLFGFCLLLGFTKCFKQGFACCLCICDFIEEASLLLNLGIGLKLLCYVRVFFVSPRLALGVLQVYFSIKPVVDECISL